MVHKEGPDTRYTTPVLILVIRLRLRSIAISRLFRLRCMGPTSRIWSCAPLHVSIWLYHRRHAPQIQAKLTMSSWRSPRSEPRRFAVIDQGPPRLIGNQHSQRATTARFQWPRATGSPSNRPLSIQGCRRTEAATSVASRLVRVRSFSKDRLDREKAHGKRVFYRRGARSALTSRVVRIRRAGSSPVRQPAGDKRIYHQLLGSGRRCSTIEKASPAAESGQPYDGPVDLLTRGAPPSGLSSP